MSGRVSLDVAGRSPASIVWDITYACPLRCVHCYSESGRRPSRQLDRDGLFRVVDAMLELQPRAIVLAGGEALLVPEVFEVGRRIVEGGCDVHLYTGGWDVSPVLLPALIELFAKVTVSIDGAVAGTHDRVRGRAGSFERALAALHRLDAAIEECCPTRHCGPALGVDYTVMRSNFAELRTFCTDVAARLHHLDYVYFGAVMPIGLGSRDGFARHELLGDTQLELLRDGRLAAELQTLAPRTAIHTGDNSMFQMHPDRLAAGAIPAMQVEPDGRVRAMPVYEGTVGSLLEESPFVLWERAVERWNDPLVTEVIRGAHTMAAWAEATRRLDLHFGSADDVARIRRRPPFGSRAAVQPGSVG